MARWRLYKGRELDDDSLAQLATQASGERALADAYRLLGHRARSREELRRRLLQKEHEEAVVDAVLERLADDGLLDDAEFARRYVADKRALGGWGAQRIRRGLAELGVAGPVIDAAVGRPRPAETTTLSSHARSPCWPRRARRARRSTRPGGAPTRFCCAAASRAGWPTARSANGAGAGHDDGA